MCLRLMTAPGAKLHAICDSKIHPISLFVSAGQVRDYIGARAPLSSLPVFEWLLGDRGYDADWFREALKNKGIRAYISGRKQRKTTINTKSATTNGATALRSCSGGSRTGDASRPDIPAFPQPASCLQNSLPGMVLLAKS